MKYAMIAGLFLSSVAVAAGPNQSPVSTVLGPKAFRDGDVIEITEVQATSPKLEHGDTVTVRGRYRLENRSEADLSLFVTQFEGDGHEEVDASQTAKIQRGLASFELKATIKHRGVLHVTFYNSTTGKPFGGVYFGTESQMKRFAHENVSYYLTD